MNTRRVSSNAPGYIAEDVGGTGEPYVVGHHLLLAHARAVEVFREEGYDTYYQRGGNNDECGKIGIANLGDYRFALDPKSEDDQEAATQSMEFQLGWMVSQFVSCQVLLLCMYHAIENNFTNCSLVKT